MRFAALTSLLLLTACILPSRTVSPRDHVMTVDAYFELQVLYHLAFEKHTYIQLNELYDLDKKTEHALHAKLIPSEHVPRVKRWHHKLRSYLVFLLTVQPTDDNGIIETSIPALLLHQLRLQSPDQIDLSDSNEDTYRRMRAGAIATTDATEQGQQTFFTDLLKVMLTMNEQAIRKYYHMFAFANAAPVEFCLQQKYKDCHELQALIQKKTSLESLTIAKVTSMVNKTIAELNKTIAVLQRLEVARLDNHSDQVNARFQDYELILMGAALQGILPIFFTDVFRDMSGKIQPSRALKIQNTEHRLLTEVSTTTVTRAVIELKKELITHWAEIKKAQLHQHRAHQKTVYLWARSSEIAVAQLLLQRPQHAPVVSYLFHQYEQQVLDNKLQKIIKAALTTAGIGTLALFATSLTPLVPINALLSKAIIIGAAANFGWIALNISNSFIAHNRHLMMERALLSGTSRRISDNLKMLQEFEAARQNAILSSTIGLSLSAGAYNQILKSLNSSTRPFLSNYIRDLFTVETNTDSTATLATHSPQ